MIEKNRHSGSWEATCDRCSTSFEELEDVSSFAEAVKEIKRLGWYVYKDDDGEWVHACSDCGMR